uniref:Uncharacterized protein n=1 Tax=Leersia perrieri TaxID=77586 RepID=A0A0D9XSR3_9ORYZ
MVTDDTLYERGGRDAANAHAERVHLEQLQAEASSAIIGATAAQEEIKRAEAARLQAELDLSEARAELAREREGASKLAQQLQSAQSALSASDQELRTSRSTLEDTKKVLVQLNTRAVTAARSLVQAFATIGGETPVGREGGQVYGECGCRSVSSSSAVGYGSWCSWATMRLLLLLLCSKSCTHIGPSVRYSPDDVTGVISADPDANSSKRDADDFAAKMWPAMGHDAAWR